MHRSRSHTKVPADPPQDARGPAATAILLGKGCFLLLLPPGHTPPPASATVQDTGVTWRCLAWEGRDGPAALGLLRAGDLP